MDDAVDGRVLLEDGVERRLVRHVGLVEEGPLAAEELDAVEGHDGRVVQAVDDDHVVAVLEEGERREGADVAGSSARGVSGSGGAVGRAWVCAYPVTRTVPTAMAAVGVVRGLRGRGGARVFCVADGMGSMRNYGSKPLMKVVQGEIKRGETQNLTMFAARQSA